MRYSFFSGCQFPDGGMRWLLGRSSSGAVSSTSFPTLVLEADFTDDDDEANRNPNAPVAPVRGRDLPEVDLPDGEYEEYDLRLMCPI